MVQIKADASAEKVIEKKRAILAAAAEEFREKGFHATGMRQIAARLGMTVGNLYYYFRNKDDLLAFCQDDTLTRLLELGRWVETASKDAAARLFLLIAGHVVCLNEGVPGSLAHLEVPARKDGALRAVLKKRDRYEQELRRVIEDGVREGIFETDDPKTAVLAILGAVNWTVRWFRPEGRSSAREVGESFARQIVRGLMKNPSAFTAPKIAIPAFRGGSPRGAGAGGNE